MQQPPRSDLELREMFWVPADLPHYADHPQEAGEKFYGFIIRGFRRLMRLQRLELVVDGVERVPATGGAVLAINHTGYFDFVYAGIAAHLRGHRLMRFMAKQEIFRVRGLGRIMNAMGHIPVDRAAGAGALDTAVREVSQGKLLGIFPEGTISRSLEVARDLRTGAVRIAHDAKVPLIPIAVWGSQRVWSKEKPRNLGRSKLPVWIRVGAPLVTTGDPVADTAVLRTAMVDLVAELRDEYEHTYGPFPGGEPWRPAALGGSAPTLDEAEAIAAQERAARQAKKQKQIAQAAASAEKGEPKKAWWAKLKR
ncbi:MAG: 1-acyl-sn-glycerol-3-phosphate acyltransferase [Corynebacterium sp.]|nr:1-acyl-sn-glycerol-3-phosphate acyltransferase [Corynebacterium sp.]